jgi:O-antigen ligase
LREIGTTVEMVDIGAGLVLLLAAIYLGTRMGRNVLFATVLVAMSVAAVMGLITWSPDLLTSFGRLTFLRLTEYSGRAIGPFFNPNYFGVCEALAFVFIVAWPGGPDSRWWRIARLVAGFCAGGGVVMSMARGAIIAVEVGLVMLAFQRGRRTGLVGLVLAVLFFFVVFPWFMDWRLSLTFGPNLQRAHEVLDESTGWRLDTLLAGLKLFRNDPIFGVGLGQFHYLSPKYLDPSVAITYSHNWYMDVLAEQGLLGFGAYLLMLLGIGWTLLRSAAPGVRGLLAMFAVFLVSCLTTEPVSSLQTTGIFWILLGLGLASALAAGNRNRPDAASASVSGGPASAAGGI